jgi:SAM-dependent MidA family methyltransferase
VLVANEVVDALPVRLFTLRADGLYARAVGADAAGRLIEREIAADAGLVQAVSRVLGGRIDTLSRPYKSEVCPLLAPWFAEVTHSLEAGAAWFIDYGYARAEYYAPARRAGTLRCHYRHRAHDDPLWWPGLQDITAWVDFDALTAAATAAGFESAGNATQAAFLIEHGLDAVFAEAYMQASDEAAKFRLAQEVKRLTLPGEMGERFRVLRFRRNG